MTAARRRRSFGRRDIVSLDEIGDGLRGRINELVVEWGLTGEWRGNEFVARNPLRADNSLGSFRICGAGHGEQGMIKDFAGNVGSARGATSPLRFTADLWFSGNMGEAVKWAKAWLGFDDTDPASIAKRQAHAAEISRDQERKAQQRAEMAQKTRAYAARLWVSASPELRATPVDRYLLGRGIDLRQLDFMPGAIRFHPALNVQETGGTAPAMLSIIGDAAGNPLMAVHRTFLMVHEDGRVTKAPLTDAKKVLGRFRGGFVSIQKGSVRDPDTGEIRKNKPLSQCKEPVWVDITEGIENALSVAIADHTLRVIAAVSLSNMGNIKLPPIVAGVRLWRDNDAPGSEADKAFAQAVESFRRQGKAVRIARPPEGIKDVNDVLRGERK